MIKTRNSDVAAFPVLPYAQAKGKKQYGYLNAGTKKLSGTVLEAHRRKRIAAICAGSGKAN